MWFYHSCSTAKGLSHRSSWCDCCGMFMIVSPFVCTLLIELSEYILNKQLTKKCQEAIAPRNQIAYSSWVNTDACCFHVVSGSVRRVRKKIISVTPRLPVMQSHER